MLRAFLTRSAAIVPSLLVILIAGDEYAEFLIVVSSVILFVQLPYALIPLVKFCGDPAIVGPLALDARTRRVMRALCALVVLANVILLIQMLHESRAVNATAGGVCLGFFVTFLAIAYVGSIAWLAARPVYGLMYLGDAQPSFGYHAWAEVAIDGQWQVLDPTWNEAVADATHLRLGSGVHDVAGMIGRLKIEVVGSQRTTRAGSPSGSEQ